MPQKVNVEPGLKSFELESRNPHQLAWKQELLTAFRCSSCKRRFQAYTLCMSKST